jgi:hypothetical protein
MRVLVYGGCHAEVLRWCLEEYAGVQADKITNFNLIETGTPFPYDRLGSYGAVIFNPIFSQTEWNTRHLEEECQRRGIPVVRYPWLEWGGYWPQTRITTTGWGKLWWCHLLDKVARTSSSFDAFVDRVFEKDTFARAASDALAASTKALEYRETWGNVDVPISSYVLEHYKSRRLFLTPSHPANELYFLVLRGIADKLGLRIDRTLFQRDAQLQTGSMLPVLPGVAQHLSLEFPAGELAHHEIFAGQFDLHGYLALHYRKSSAVMLTATTNTSLEVDGEEALRAGKGARVVGSTHSTSSNGHLDLDALAYAGFGNRRPRRKRLRLNSSHWTVKPLERSAGSDGVKPTDKVSPTAALARAAVVGAQ